MLLNTTYPIINQKFNYQPLSRTNEDGIRKYLTPDGNRLPSVTSILDKTKSEESKAALQNWRNRVGHAQAQTITTEAAGVGTTMHTMLEEYCLGKAKPPGSNTVQQIAWPMAQQIIQNGLSKLDEIWGNEVSVYYPELYAGSTDLVGVWNKKEAIIDFKQTNRPKKDEYVEDYKVQTVFYGTAHNKIHGSNIRTGVILMCSRDCQYQQWVIEGKEWDYYEGKMWDRIEQYYLLKA